MITSRSIDQSKRKYKQPKYEIALTCEIKACECTVTFGMLCAAAFVCGCGFVSGKVEWLGFVLVVCLAVNKTDTTS